MDGAFRLTEKLNEWLRIKDWTQRQLAEALGCHETEISQWFTKKPKHPSWQILRKICLLTGLDISELLTFDRNIEQED